MSDEVRGIWGELGTISGYLASVAQSLEAISCAICIPNGWTPTADNINALPAPLRQYIHDLETRCDHTGEVAALALAKENIKALELLRDEQAVQIAERDARLAAALTALRKAAGKIGEDIKAEAMHEADCILSTAPDVLAVVDGLYVEGDEFPLRVSRFDGEIDAAHNEMMARAIIVTRTEGGEET